METTATRAAVYLRVSLDATGQGLAVDRQREDCRRIAEQRGWAIVAEYTDNSISASDKSKHRPAYDRMVAAYEGGEFGALICYDLDRLTRQPRQLEDWIDAADERGLLLVTANGEADLSTDGGRLFARIKASVARAEVERKSARQTRAAVQRAEHGRPPLGVRLTGYTPSGELVPAEAVVVRKLYERFAAGDSLRGLVTWLAETGIETRRGRPWNPSTVRTLLLNPRYCGRAIYQGSETGALGGWDSIVDEGLYDTVKAALNDPRRRTQVGTDRRHLGSSLYLCGICDTPLYSHSGSRYRCPVGGHLIRSAAPIDEFVCGLICERLGRPDLHDLLRAPDNAKARDLVAGVRRIRNRLAAVERDYDADLIDGRRYQIKTAKLRAELAIAESTQARFTAGSGVAGLLAAPDPAAAFMGSPLGTQRAVVEFFMVVRLTAAPRGRKGFDPDTVRLDWRTP